jgi:glycerate dehydrogenase
VARTPFEEVIRRATVIFLTLPRTPESVNLISTKELGEMSPKTVVINVSRGGIVDEAAIVDALKEGKIAGYATDVTTVEPADGGEDSPLLADDARDLNITVTPHLAWCAGMTLKNLQRILKENVELWVAGKPKNVIVPGGPIENGVERKWNRIGG